MDFKYFLDAHKFSTAESANTHSVKYQMNPLFYRVSTRIKYQAPIAIFMSTLLAVALWQPQFSGAKIGSLDSATYVTVLSAIASILALFCSLSIAWILFVAQQNKAERLATYDLLKARLYEAQQWLLEQDASDDQELCLSLVWELNKHELSDLPLTDRGQTYEDYVNALDTALDGEDAIRRRFFCISIGHFGYIEDLLNRIGIVSIRQVITKVFLETFTKGISLICLAVMTLVASAIWYAESTKPWFMLIASFIAIGSVFLLLEIVIHIYRDYSDELDFIEKTPNADEDAI